MNKYEKLAKRIFDLVVPRFKQKPVFCVSDDIILTMFAAELERELAPLVEAAKKIQETDVKRGWLCRTDNRCERCAVCELETALKGWTR